MQKSLIFKNKRKSYWAVWSISIQKYLLKNIKNYLTNKHLYGNIYTVKDLTQHNKKHGGKYDY